MKKIYILLCVLGWAGCSPENDAVLDMGYHLDKVVCTAGSNYFVADGVSELGLEVKFYTKSGTYTDVNGIEQPTYLEIPKARLRQHTVKFFDRAGTEYAPDFKSTTLTPGIKEFYAEVDGMRSGKPVLQLLAENPATGTPIAAQADPVFFTMNVRAAEPVPAKKRYPVVFHILETESSRNQMQEIDANAVHYVINMWNNVFGRKDSRASNGANPNIEFVAALRNPGGIALKEPGINRVYLTSSQANSIGTGSIRDMAYWDFDRYLNIWIVPMGVSYSATTVPQLYQRAIAFNFPTGVYSAVDFPLPASVTLKEHDAASYATWKGAPANLEQVGLVFDKGTFANIGGNYVGQMAAFLGVIPNSSVNATSTQFGSPKRWVDDFCDDTFTFNPFYQSTSEGGLDGVDFGNSRTKYTATPNAAGNSGTPGAPWIIYNSSTVGESSSFASVVTQDQARRIEWALQNAPARQAWRNPFAIE